MTFDPNLPDGTDTGPTVVTDTRNNLNELKTLIDGKVPQTGSGTWDVTPTWSGQHVWDAAGIVVKRSTGGDFVILEHKTIESGHSNAHKMRVLATDAGATTAWRPVIDGTDTPGDQLMFNYGSERWEIGNTGDQVFHAGNFDPANIVPTTMKTGRTRRKVTKLTSSASVSLAPDTDGQLYVIQLAHTATFSFSLPSGADSDLGDHWALSGAVLIENISGAGAITLQATGADKTEENGTQDNTVGNVMVLGYVLVRADYSGERQFAFFSWSS